MASPSYIRMGALTTTPAARPSNYQKGYLLEGVGPQLASPSYIRMGVLTTTPTLYNEGAVTSHGLFHKIP